MRQIKKNSTNVSVELYIVDATAGTPETGVVYNTSGIDINYRRDGAALTSITEANLTTPALTDAHADGGFLHVANGRYRLDVPDAAFATGVSQVTVGGTVTGMIVLPVTIQLVGFDPDDATRLGLTAMPSAAADAAGGLPISDGGGLNLDALNTAAVRLTAARAAVLDDWINAGRLDAILDVIAADVVNLDGSAMLTAAAVNSEVVDVLRTDAPSELSAVPAAAPALHAMVQYIYMKIRNKETQTATLKTIANDAGTVIGSSVSTDDATTFTKNKYS
jgi:hypothetical protein